MKTIDSIINTLVFDYDQTLVDNGEVMPLLKKLVDLGVTKIKVWSNGNSWIRDGILESLGIKAEHIRIQEELINTISDERFNADTEICLTMGEELGMAHNVSVPKYAQFLPAGQILIDDLAPIWSRISGVKVMTPDEALSYLERELGV